MRIRTLNGDNILPPSEELPDIRIVKPDLFVPPMTISNPALGNRIRQVAPEYRDTEIYHALYLPTNWQEGKRYTVIVEYAGNETSEPYRNHTDTWVLRDIPARIILRQWLKAVIQDSLCQT